MGKIKLFQPDYMLDRLLLDRENIPLLEQLIEKEGKLFARLERLKQEGKLDFGKEIAQVGIGDEFEEEVIEEIYTIFEKVQPDINKFLGVKEADPSKPIDLFLVDDEILSSYYPDSRLIAISVTNSVQIAMDLGHEYTHHILCCLLPDLFKENEKRYSYGISEEGYARGVERYISRLYAEREANEAFLHENTHRNLFELLSSYKWICFALDIEPSPEIIRQGQHLNKEDQDYSVDNWAKGNALFYTQETLHGNRIYREVLEENRKKQ